MVLAPFVAAALFPFLTIQDFLHLLRCGSLGAALDAHGCLEHGRPYYDFRRRIKSLLRGVCAVGLATPAADAFLRGVFTPILHSRADCLTDFLVFTQLRWNVDLRPAEGLEAVCPPVQHCLRRSGITSLYKASYISGIRVQMSFDLLRKSISSAYGNMIRPLVLLIMVLATLLALLVLHRPRCVFLSSCFVHVAFFKTPQPIILAGPSAAPLHRLGVCVCVQLRER